MLAEMVSLPRVGDVDSVGLIDGESREENAMEPITAAIVIVAVWTLIPICISKWVEER